MIYLRYRNSKRRLVFFKREFKKLLLKSFMVNEFIPVRQRVRCRYENSILPRTTSLSFFKNRCILTGRGNAFERKFRISRMKFNELAGRGLLPGVKRSTW